MCLLCQGNHALRTEFERERSEEEQLEESQGFPGQENEEIWKAVTVYLAGREACEGAR
jgi:hypothetical protein